jgi:protein-S-isoprenylcysteine O-methyltransferase Ste14
MTGIDAHVFVRAASLYVAVVATATAVIWRRPTARQLTGALLAALWNLPALLMVNVIAIRLGWWRFEADGGLLLGVPVDLLLAWGCLWGLVPAIALPSLSLLVVGVVALGIDVVVMPAAEPVIQLGPTWIVGETLAIFAALVPSQLLARWTARDERLVGRALLQVGAFTGLVVFILPTLAIEGSGGAWLNPLERPAWLMAVIVQMLALPAVIGLSAVQEFVTRGSGTPLPFDPPQRLVTTGLYAYVRNPMQLSAVLLLALLGVVLGNLWVSAAGVMAHLYSVGLAGWDEDDDLIARFGDDWNQYRDAVPRWRPRFRPWHRGDAPPARLFVAEACGMCSQVGQWFMSRGALHLEIVPASAHPSRALTRIRYELPDGTGGASGVAAIARALEHIHVGWAFVGAVLRLPIVGTVVQLVVDASGGEPRLLARSGDDVSAAPHGFAARPRQRRLPSVAVEVNPESRDKTFELAAQELERRRDEQMVLHA